MWLFAEKSLVAGELARPAAYAAVAVLKLADLGFVKNEGRGGRVPAVKAAILGPKQGKLPHPPHRDVENPGRLGRGNERPSDW